MKPIILIAPLVSAAMLFGINPTSAQNTSPVGTMTVSGITQAPVLPTAKVVKAANEYVYIYSYSITAPAPSAPASRTSTATASKGTVVVTKAVDALSPKFMQASTTGEVLKTVVIQLTKVGANGQSAVYETVTLKNSLITKFTQSGSSREEITFTYQAFQYQTSQTQTNVPAKAP